MAYGEYIRCTFDDAAEQECIISIYRDGYTDAVVEVNGGPEPIRIEMMAAGDHKYTPIKATEAYIQLVSTTSFQYLPLFTGTNKQHKVVFTVGGDVKWTGWINPELYTEPFDYPPYIVTVHAVDGLAMMKEVLYDTIDMSVYTAGGWLRYLHEIIILNILYDIGLDIGYEAGIDLQFLSNLSAPAAIVSDRILEELTVDIRTFRNDDGTMWNHYDILDTLLTSLQCRVYQVDGKWRIDNIDQKIDTYSRDIYLSNGTFFQTVAGYDDREALTSAFVATKLRFESGASLEIEPAFKEFDIEHEYGQKLNVLQMNNFEGLFFADEFIAGSPVTMHNWSFSSSPVPTVAHESDMNAVRIEAWMTGAVDAEWMWTGLEDVGVMGGFTDYGDFIDAWTNDEIRVRLYYEYYAKTTAYRDAEGVFARSRLKFDFGGNEYCYGNNGTGLWAWGAAAANVDDIFACDWNQWYTNDVLIPKPPQNEYGTTPAYITVSLKLFKGWSNTDTGDATEGLCFRNVRVSIERMEKKSTKVTVLVQVKADLANASRAYMTNRRNRKNFINTVKDLSVEIDDYSRTITTTVSANNIFKPDAFPVQFGESPDVFTGGYGQGLCHLYNFYHDQDWDGSNYVRYWAKKGDATCNQDLINGLIKTDLTNLYSYPTFRLRGKIHDRGSLMSFASVIKDYSSRYYFINAVTWNPKDMTWDGEFIQFFPNTIGGDFLETDFNIDFYIE